MVEAFNEAIRKYPEALKGLVWFVTAAQLNEAPINQEMLDWANSQIADMDYYN